jgi:uronate dehydrogenase
LKKVLLTGSAGDIGGAFRAFARDRYDFVCFDKRPTPGVPGAFVADLADFEAVKKAAQGCQAVIHLGGFRNAAPFHDSILPSNILGTYHAYEAARLAGVQRFIFASTMQVDGGHPRGTQVFPDRDPRKPGNIYAVAKGLGEDMGRVYAEQHGMSVICLRFGWFNLDREAGWLVHGWYRPPAIMLSERDCNEVLAHSLEAEDVHFAVLHAFSRDSAPIRDLAGLEKTLGYAPQDEIGKAWDQAGSPWMWVRRFYSLCYWHVRRFLWRTLHRRRWKEWQKLHA